MNLIDILLFNSKNIQVVPKDMLAFPLCKKAIELSTDHKAFKWDESRRIIKAGGRVCDDKIVLMGAPMPLLGIPRVQGSLAISRVIGIVLCDFFFNSCISVAL